MTKDVVLQKVKAIIGDETGVMPEELTPETTLREELGADDLDIADIFLCVEEEFEVPFEDPEIDPKVDESQDCTIGFLADYIHKNG